MSTRALGEFLRERRARLRPSDVGLLAATSRRRTPGLRRDEVASQSRMSTEYYTQLEQARGAHPSGEMLDSIARALRLTRTERDHLYHLAGLGPRLDREAPRVAPDSLLALLDRMTDTAILVVDARHELVAWNRLSELLFEENFAKTPPSQRSFARRHFLGAGPQGYRFGTHSSNNYAFYLAAELRRTHARYPEDASIIGLVEELRNGSPLFEELWQTGEVTQALHLPKKLMHGKAGLIRVRCDVLVVPEHDLRVVLFTAKPRTRSARAIRALAAGVPEAQRGTRHVAAAE